jgi:hypothetical protein
MHSRNSQIPPGDSQGLQAQLAGARGVGECVFRKLFLVRCGDARRAMRRVLPAHFYYPGSGSVLRAEGCFITVCGPVFFRPFGIVRGVCFGIRPAGCGTARIPHRCAIPKSVCISSFVSFVRKLHAGIR